ncbi:MAG TPA: hypothetical protein VHG10_09485 [Glycomyces sp.]|nr:hypothetical protein [Glycomyces sp.]
MSSGKLRTLTIGKANRLPKQGEAPHTESTPLGEIQGHIESNSPAPGLARPEKPSVRLRRLAGVAVWALCLVLAGVATAIVGLFQVFGDGPAWFTPAFITCGVAVMLLTMMAFASLRFRGVPWMFMAAATITLLAAFVLLRLA